MVRDYAELYNEDINFTKGPLDADWDVRKVDNEIRITFEGSKSVRDFIQDLKFFSKSVEPFKDCVLKLHTGFWEAYSAVRKDVLDKCFELYKDGDTFLIKGHSLAGAMSIICAEDIEYHFGLHPTVITWGHPRVTKDKKTQTYLQNCMSDDSIFFKNGSDVVPTLPFSFWNDFERTKLGGRYNFFAGWWDILRFKFKYHCGYGDKNLYK